jgi:hypothetical protein
MVRNIPLFGGSGEALQSGNYRSLLLFEGAVQKAWHKWLCRRSQRHRLWWNRYSKLLRSYWRLPPPRIAVRIWSD